MSHISPTSVYYTIFGTLMVLTAITVSAAYADLGEFNALVALGIATFKATLVILYFMHVKYSSRLTKLVVLTSFFFMAILIFETMADYASREWVLPIPPHIQ